MRRYAGPGVEKLDLIKRLAVLPYFVGLSPDPVVSAVHQSDQEVEEDDGGDALEEGPPQGLPKKTQSI